MTTITATRPRVVFGQVDIASITKLRVHRTPQLPSCGIWCYERYTRSFEWPRVWRTVDLIVRSYRISRRCDIAVTCNNRIPRAPKIRKRVRKNKNRRYDSFAALGVPREPASSCEVRSDVRSFSFHSIFHCRDAKNEIIFVSGIFAIGFSNWFSKDF